MNNSIYFSYVFDFNCDLFLSGNDTAGYGKCSHGGKNDAYSAVNAVGGINKETSDSNLSPHFFLHAMAGETAIAATAQFFVGEGE
jgi:hypothetical protein